MAKVAAVEALFALLSNPNEAEVLDVVKVLEDAILEGVEDAPKGARYVLVERKAWTKFGVTHPAEREQGAFAVITKTSVRLVGVRYLSSRPRQGGADHRAYDRTFEVGDEVEYGSFNLRYHGTIASIDRTGNVSVLQNGPESRKRRLSLQEFTWRNWNLDLADAKRENSETMMYI